METALIVFKQTVVMFLYMFAGYVLFKTGKMTIRGSRDVAALLVNLVIPVVIVNSFCIERTADRASQLFRSTALSAFCLVISMIIAALVFSKKPVDNFGAAFSNAGFIGIPLVQSVFGNTGVFWIVGMVVLLNILQYSYGVRIITGERSATGLRHLLLNPIFIAAVIGVILFITGAGGHLPAIARITLEGISSLNAPLAMIVLGSYMAQADLKKTFTSAHLYALSAVRLLLIPAVTMLILSVTVSLAQDVVMAVFITAATPIGANVAVYSQLYDCDYPYACQTVVITTLLSVVTLPLMLIAASMLTQL